MNKQKKNCNIMEAIAPSAMSWAELNTKFFPEKMRELESAMRNSIPAEDFTQWRKGIKHFAKKHPCIVGEFSGC